MVRTPPPVFCLRPKTYCFSESDNDFPVFNSFIFYLPTFNFVNDKIYILLNIIYFLPEAAFSKKTSVRFITPTSSSKKIISLGEDLWILHYVRTKLKEKRKARHFPLTAGSAPTATQRFLMNTVEGA
jgi:hypothetical protein